MRAALPARRAEYKPETGSSTTARLTIADGAYAFNPQYAEFGHIVDEHLYIVAYDIANPKRWRRVFRLMEGYGDWLQLSIFQCRLSRKRHAEMVALLDGIIHHREDHILTMDLGVADSVKPRVVSLGKEFQAVERQPVIV